jgi:hypothetical protein
VTSLLTCAACVHAAAHGWWGPGVRGTHCPECHRSWSSPVQVHCVVCHEQFATDNVARLHWTRTGHVHPATVDRLAPHHERDGVVWRRTGGRPERPEVAWAPTHVAMTVTS